MSRGCQPGTVSHADFSGSTAHSGVRSPAAASAAPDGRKGMARAVIDIGSSAIRMVVAEVAATGAIRILDRADRPVPLGHDVFGSGTASRTTIGASLEALASFQELLRGWGIGSEETAVIATSALREAENRDTFVDRVALRTGLDVRVIDGVEENRLTYLSAVHAIKAAIPGFARSNSLIMQIGTGSTEFMLLRRGRMAFVHSLKLGSARMEGMLRPVQSDPERLRRVLSETVAPTREALSHEQPLQHIRRFVAAGGVIRLAASRSGRRIAEHCSLIERPALQALIRRLQPLRVEELVQRLEIPYEDAEGILPDLIVYDLFLESTAAQQVIVPELSIREGVLLSAAFDDERSRREFELQTIASALSVARKYHAEDPHVRHVTKLALRLFDLLTDDHGLGARERLLLHVAALLHEVGKLIKASGHHRHGAYIVANTEVFGIDEGDTAVVANVVRYHRRALPQMSHPMYAGLSRRQRLVVNKLAAILRVADALDVSHLGRIDRFDAERSTDLLRLKCGYHGDLSLERMALARKADLMEHVFGLRVELS